MGGERSTTVSRALRNLASLEGPLNWGGFHEATKSIWSPPVTELDDLVAGLERLTVGLAWDPNQPLPSLETEQDRAALVRTRTESSGEGARTSPAEERTDERDPRREAAKLRICRANLAQAVFLAYGYHIWAHVPLPDLVAAAQAGLRRAADKYDPDRGYPFFSYAQMWVTRALGRACSDLRGIPTRYLQPALAVEEIVRARPDDPNAELQRLEERHGWSPAYGAFLLRLLEAARSRKRGEAPAVQPLIDEWEAANP